MRGDAAKAVRSIAAKAAIFVPPPLTIAAVTADCTLK